MINMSDFNLFFRQSIKKFFKGYQPRAILQR
jgi:hypothetical protein